MGDHTEQILFVVIIVHRGEALARVGNEQFDIGYHYIDLDVM